MLDDLNWHILEELQRDGRLAAAEIGRRVGLSAPAVADRIQKLEELGYIKGYRTVVDLDKLGLSIRAFILYKSTGLKHNEMLNLMASISEIVDWHTVTGNYSGPQSGDGFEWASCGHYRAAGGIWRDEYFADPGG